MWVIVRVEGVAANSAISEKLIESVVEYIIRKEDLLQKLGELLKLNDFEKKGENYDKSDISKFLIDKSVVIGDVINLILENFEKNKVESKEFLEQVNKVRGMEKELETLGNGLLAQGLISGAAVTTLTGALAGLLTVGGVTGALIVGGAAFVGFMALVAIVAIGYAIYQHRGEIQKGVIDTGKAVKSFLKDMIDKLPTFQARENNFKKLINNLMEENLEADEEKKTMLSNKIKIIKMLQNQEQLAAIKQLIGKDKVGLLNNVISKGTSTHEEDMKKFVDFMSEFQPAVMAIGSDIKGVEEIVNERVAEMKPSSEVKSPNSEQMNEQEKGKE